MASRARPTGPHIFQMNSLCGQHSSRRPGRSRSKLEGLRQRRHLRPRAKRNEFRLPATAFAGSRRSAVQPNLKEWLLSPGPAAARGTPWGLFVAVMDAEPATSGPAGLIARLRAKLSGGSSEASLTRRLAGTIFIIRVISAGLAYFSQVLLARWMGTSDYGIYVYVWTWVLLLGSMVPTASASLSPTLRGAAGFDISACPSCRQRDPGRSAWAQIHRASCRPCPR